MGGERGERRNDAVTRRVAVCFQQFLVVGADRFRADELYLGDSFSIAPADFRIYFGGYMQNDRVVTGICMMSVFEPV